MAYKNQKKNKRAHHQLRVSQGGITVKHIREQEREDEKYRIKHPDSELTTEKIEQLLKERGLM